ncbi:MAG: hypothetical protein EBU90_10825 [Proteobacteria bacterium]|nr:hypothetical protein [Pseudomonadota bacterium]NBP14649.1 hypothetical protein [bacterium]
MFQHKYAPNSQKALFQKEVVSLIRKWCNTVQTSSNKQQILLVHGPMGSGKSSTLRVLLKPFTVHSLDPDILRSFTDDTIRGNVVSYHSKTISTNKNNVILIDNVELCEKTIRSFVDAIYLKHNVSVPIVLVYVNSKLSELFSDLENVTIVRFGKPSLLEMNKLSLEVIQSEFPTWYSTLKDYTRELVSKSEFDLRQLYYILEQLRLHLIFTKDPKQFNFAQFIDSLSVKETELDIHERIRIVFSPSEPYDFENVLQCSLAEPQAVSNAIFQNYVLLSLDLATISDIADDLSRGSIIQSKIFDNQWWYLYEDLTIVSCVYPSYRIKTYTQKCETNFVVTSFKDVSCNFMNSYAEVKRIHLNNYIKLTKASTNTHTFFDILSDPCSCFYVADILIRCFKKVGMYFELNKKGKNISRKEKVELCDQMNQCPDTFAAFEIIVSIVYCYVLFDVDIDTLHIKRRELQSSTRQFQYQQLQSSSTNLIDLKVLKRFLNIFTMDSLSQKVLKSHTEIALQHTLLKKVLVDTHHIKVDIDHLHVNLENLWKFSN